MNKSIIHHFRSRLRAREHLFLAVATAMACGTLTEVAHAQIFVPNYGNGNVGEYSTAGATINASLLTGLTEAATIAAAGTSLFIETDSNDNIGKYTTAGATVSATFITGTGTNEYGLALSGNTLFAARFGTGIVSEYNATTGALTGTISGLSEPTGLAVSGTTLYVANYSTGTIGEYTTAGATLSASFVTGLSGPWGLVVTGGDLYVMNEEASGRVGVYNATTGAVINSALFSTGTTSYGLALLGPNLLTANFTAGTIGEYTPRSSRGWTNQWTSRCSASSPSPPRGRRSRAAGCWLWRYCGGAGEGKDAGRRQNYE